MHASAVIDFGKRLVGQVVDDEVPELAAGLAYRFLFALFPFGVFLAALAAFIAQWAGMGDPTDEILAAIGDNLPPDVAQQIAPQLETVLGRARPGLVSIGAVAALWAATGGVSSLINAMNKAYDIPETRNFLGRTSLAVGLTVLGAIGILAAFVTVVGGSVITEQAIETLGVGSEAWDVIALLRWPLVLALVAAAVSALFRFGPNVAVSFRWTLVGGVVFAIGWVAATGLFGLYVANFGSYANTYGALGGVIVLMLWFYLTALLLLVAAEVTSLLAVQHEPERLQARRDETAGADAAKAETGTDADTDSRTGEERPARRLELQPSSGPVSVAASRPVPAPPPRAAPHRGGASWGFALAVVLAGGIAGVLAGLLAGDEEAAAG